MQLLTDGISLIRNGRSISIGHKKVQATTQKEQKSKPSRNGGGSGMSKRSHTTFRKQISSLVQLPPNSGTLTFPSVGTAPIDPRALRYALDEFGRGFRRVFPQGYVFWRVEPHSTGRPHIHLLGDFCSMPLPQLRLAVQSIWLKALGRKELRNNLHILTQVKEVREFDLDKAALYILKEVDLHAEYRNMTRHGSVPHKWGIIGRKNIVRVPEQRRVISSEQAEQIKAIILFHLDYQLEFLEYTPNGKRRQKKLKLLMWKVQNDYDVALHMLPLYVLAQIQGVLDSQQ